MVASWTARSSGRDQDSASAVAAPSGRSGRVRQSWRPGPLSRVRLVSGRRFRRFAEERDAFSLHENLWPGDAPGPPNDISARHKGGRPTWSVPTSPRPNAGAARSACASRPRRRRDRRAGRSCPQEDGRLHAPQGAGAAGPRSGRSPFGARKRVELHRIGVNPSQIARALNSGASAPGGTLEAVERVGRACANTKPPTISSERKVPKDGGAMDSKKIGDRARLIASAKHELVFPDAIRRTATSSPRACLMPPESKPATPTSRSSGRSREQ